MNPKSVDLRPLMNEVEDQGADGACTGYGGARSMDALYERAGINKKFACEFLWYMNKKFNQLEFQTGNYGTKFTPIFSNLANIGLCEDSFYPDTTPRDTKPSNEAMANAAQHRIVSWMPINPIMFDPVKRIKTALAMGYPVVIAVNFYWAKEITPNDTPWREQVWEKAAPLPDNPGGHCICIIGYDDDAQRFLLQNSWGPAWGDGGFFGWPYSFFEKEGGVIIRDLGVPFPDSSVPIINAGHVPDLPNLNPGGTAQDLQVLNDNLDCGFRNGGLVGPDGQAISQSSFVYATDLARRRGFQDSQIADYIGQRYGGGSDQQARLWLAVHKFFG
jgi:hypothetical protein